MRGGQGFREAVAEHSVQNAVFVAAVEAFWKDNLAKCDMKFNQCIVMFGPNSAILGVATK